MIQNGSGSSDAAEFSFGLRERFLSSELGWTFKFQRNREGPFQLYFQQIFNETGNYLKPSFRALF